MIALVVLGIAAVGALSALMSARQQLRDGQSRVVKAALAESGRQTRAWARETIIPPPPATKEPWPGSAVELLAANAGVATAANPWIKDPGGTFFKIDGTGSVTAVGTPAGVAK